MEKFVFFILCSLTVVVAEDKVTLQRDRPFLRVLLSDPAYLSCCYKGAPDRVIWKQRVHHTNQTTNEVVEESSLVTTDHSKSKDFWCGTLSIKSVQLNDTGLYRCFLNASNMYTHGTYLQVFAPLEKTINLSESTKNKILVVEGILLLLCVLLPSTILLMKSKNLHELEKKKSRKEEENIYQGLNLDDCCETYEQIECTTSRGHYQDVGTSFHKDEDIQLEKP